MSGPEFRGVFDIHLTVAADEVGPLGDWAREHGVKFTHIVLERGTAPSQPMLTVRGEGTLGAQRTAAAAHTARLRDEGFRVVRVKIEAAPWNEDVPQTAEAAAAMPGRYFEHHVKVAVRGDLAPLADLAVVHGAHVSRNARRQRDDGSHERFVTQRCRGVGLATAGRRFEALLSDLEGHGYAVLEAEREYVVHDDNPGIDHGWIEER
ncbi:hypothetical protein [Microbispora sp. KK1-11]|uniref:hypothetical protein n=1 Tax=Microbispora sp. KK1-11 TaxID=2053005 RepID=UPI0011577A7B|nr:hypothetical protein [Microbispora sp. KK1-11]TQS19229.1 hypothetical protein FLW16_41950 [Microbispora sp. KK1-11]